MRIPRFVRRWFSASKRDLQVDRKLLHEARIGAGWGGRITPEGALSISAAYAAINTISTDIASLPLKTYQRLPDGGRREAREHPVYDLLANSPDDETTAIRWRQALIGHSLGVGNGYSEIRFDSTGRPAKLHLMNSREVEPKRTDSGSLYYSLGGGKTLPPRRVIHIAGFGWDGLCGYSPITLSRRTFELSRAAEAYGAKFFENGSMPGGWIQYPGELPPEAIKNLRESWERMHSGDENWHRVAVLEEGASYHPITISQEDAQYLETRQFQVVEIARLFRVPPHKIGDYSQMQLASAAVEAANLDYLQTTLMPWCEQIEQELNRKLFTREERLSGYYVEHNMDAFARGDMRTRAEYYTRLRDLGALSPNEIRAKENMNPIEGGDVYLIPLNMTPLEKVGMDQDEGGLDDSE